MQQNKRFQRSRLIDVVILQLVMLSICNKSLVASARSYSTSRGSHNVLRSALKARTVPNQKLAFHIHHGKAVTVRPCRPACSFAPVSRYSSSSRLLESPVDNNSSYDVILNGLNEAQIQAVTQPLESITRVVAGPGAGKTRVLTCRIAYLLKKDNEDENGKTNSRILAVTFTKKASSEMQRRLESLLREDEEYQNRLMPTNDAPENGDDGIYEEVVEQDGRTRYGSASSMITRVSLGTFHSICAKILRWNGSELGRLPSIQHYKTKGQDGDMLDSSFAIIDQSEQMRVIKKCLTDAGVDLKGSGRGQADIRPVTILNAVGQLKSDDAMGVDSRSSPDDNEEKPGGGVKMTSKVRKIAENVYPMYRTALLSQNSMDFDDLILLARELLKTNEDVRERMAKRWQHVLIDEFQDTSEVQLDLVRLLSRDSLLIVGDGDQSIYSWRGANVESMSDFAHKFDKAKSVETVYLMENYRSTTNIVKAAQKVISDKSSNDSNTAIRQDMKPMRGMGPSPRVLACADAKAEATFVVKEINKMVDEGVLNPSSTVALIYRTNAQSRALEEACVAHNLKYLVRGSAGTFYSRAEVKDCLCFLKWLYNGRDQTAMTRAMQTPSRGLGNVSINEFTLYCEEVRMHVATNDPGGPQPTPLDILLSLAKSGQGDDRSYLPPDGVITKRTLNRLLPFAMQMNRLSRKAHSETVSELLGSIIDIMSLKNHFDGISKTSDEFADRWANVMELLNASERYTQDGSCMEKKQVDIDGELRMEEMSPLGNFLDDVSLLTETEDANNEDDNGEKRILANLMTIHASKGMEFDAVFLVGNEEATFPTQRAIMEGNGSIELDEERRLCYVAMTRAKTHLIMTWRREVTTFFGQGFKVNKPERSRFLDALMAKKGTKDAKNDPSATKPRAGSSRRKDPLALPIIAKGVPTTRAGASTEPDADYAAKKAAYDRRMAKNMLLEKAEARAEKEKWSNYHASKRSGTASTSPRDRTPPGRTTRSGVSAMPKSAQTPTTGASERGRRAISTRSSIPIGGQSPVKRRSPDPPPPRKTSTPRSNSLREEKRPERDAAPPPEMDSTMFFPIGSGVKHVIHGEGKVVTPSEGQDTMMVNVKFESGMQMDFTIGSPGLMMKY